MPSRSTSSEGSGSMPKRRQKPCPSERRPASIAGRLAAGDRGDDLVLLGLRVERAVVDHVAAVDLLRDRAAALARLADDLLGGGDLRARLLGVGRGRVPLEDLIAVTVSDDDATHPDLQLV